MAKYYYSRNIQLQFTFDNGNLNQAEEDLSKDHDIILMTGRKDELSNNFLQVYNVATLDYILLMPIVDMAKME